MKEPCRSCPEKEKDFGGCRCQAYLLTGDAANADPVCGKSPHHYKLDQLLKVTDMKGDHYTAPRSLSENREPTAEKLDLARFPDNFR